MASYTVESSALHTNKYSQAISIWVIECFRGGTKGGRNFTSFLRFFEPFSCSNVNLFYLKTFSPVKRTPEAPLDWNEACLNYIKICLVDVFFFAMRAHRDIMEPRVPDGKRWRYREKWRQTLRCSHLPPLCPVPIIRIISPHPNPQVCWSYFSNLVQKEKSLLRKPDSPC